ncbi:MAG: glycosyltransferase family 2 protein [Firmicutes bacterium]|nr:glycosyltransferase family 2 protein [Bacillota bacterium]
MAARKSGLVSVIVTAWNRRAYVLDCLRSIVRQTYPHLEIIVVDDGSTDGSPQAIRAWRQSLSPDWQKRVLLIALPRNTGYAGALTAGLFAARGQYIAVQDSDDKSAPQRLEKQVRFLRQHPEVGLVGSDYRVFAGKVIETQKPTWLRYGWKSIRQCYAEGGHCVSLGTALFRASIFDKQGGLTRRVSGAEDYEFIARMINGGMRIDNLNEVLYYIRKHPTQRSKRFYK